MKKRFLGLITLFLISTALLAACGSSVTEEELEYRNQGIALMDVGEYERALEMFNNALGESVGVVAETEVDICMYKGLALFKLQRYDEAMETYNAVINVDAKNPTAYYYRGTIALECGDEAQALSDYNHTVEFQKDYATYTAIAENLMDKGYDKDAMTYIRQALVLEPKTTEEKRNQAYLYNMSGDTETARATYEQLAAEGDEESLVFLSKFAIGQADYTGALAYIEQGLALNGSFYGEFLFQQGVCYEYQENYTQAYEVFKRYLEIFPDDEEAQREARFLSTRE